MRLRFIIVCLTMAAHPATNRVKARKNVFPCGYCERDVSWSHSAVYCDACDIWFHRSCHSISVSTYNNLDEESWRCFKCLTFMSDSFSFHSYETRPSNTDTSTRPLHINTSTNGNSPHRFNFRPSAHSTPEIPTTSVHKHVTEASCMSQSTINSDTSELLTQKKNN